ncbi:restriction endonuclease subunit S [Bacteroides fragilis]|uniref:restriction endonuclease subunit S n=1 Tax=Bacteroides fragilis TaxID=817 RepID=UPI0009BA8178|nr:MULTISPECIES: restriction endonuclease subunit S [Bacteroides]MCE9480318.1 restriction endonuclease subunit S [Bacteroides fragilis]MCS3369058.1 restriction endonuclease subunit S [Bacteroides thetaiotaomicron]
MANNNENKVLNVPHLRFPEFNGEWETKLINDLAVVIGGGTPDTTIKSYWDGEIQWFTPSEIGKNKYVDSSLRTITEEGLNNSSAKLLPPNTILLSSRATIGECSLSLRECATNQGFQSLVSKKCYVDFLYYLIQTKKRDLIRKSCGSTFLEISANEVRKIQVSVPTDVEQQKIAGLLSLIDERIATQNKIIEDLKKLKSAIRKKMFSLLKDEYTESFEINQLLDYEQPTAYIVANDEYSTDTSLTPVLTANKGFILGYTDEKFGIYQKGECIIFDDFTMDAKYVSFPFKVKSSAIKILTAKPNVNLRFMFEYLSYWELKSEEHKRHYISEIASLVIELPSKERQSIIASLMTSLNSKLDIEAKTKIRYEEQKRYLLSQMFI